MKTYLIHAPEVHRVKIGVSLDFKRRIVLMQTESPCKLFVIGITDGDIEKELHFKYKKHKTHGEWFDDLILNSCLSYFTIIDPPYSPASREEQRMVDFDEAVTLRAMGLTYQEIGKRFGVSRQAIHQIIENYKRNLNLTNEEKDDKVKT